MFENTMAKIYQFHFRRKDIIFFLIYSTLVILATPNSLTWWFRVSFWLFCVFLFWSLLNLSSEQRNDLSIFRQRTNYLLIAFVVIFLILTRILPFLRWGWFPLGYDTGIYRKNFEMCQAIGGCQSSPYTLITNVLHLVGWQSDYFLSIFYVFMTVLAGLLLFVVARRYFSDRGGLIALLLFTLSSSQFLAFQAFYWAMMMALVLGLASFWLLERKSWLVIPIAGFMGAIHPLSFLPFGLALIAEFIFQISQEFTSKRHKRNRSMEGADISLRTRAKNMLSSEASFLFWAGVLIFLVAVSLSWQVFLSYIPFYADKFGRISNFPVYLSSELSGQYIDFEAYKKFILIYLPFALFGLVNLLKKRRFHFLFFYFAVNLFIICFNFIFHNRYIILLDVICILLAGEPLWLFLTQLWSRRVSQLAAAILIGAGIFTALFQGWRVKPLISKEELASIRSIPYITENNSYVMTVASYYAPWVYGFSQRKTIAPGLFEYNKWDMKKWWAFWTSDNQELRHQFLDEYQKPLYIFIGDRIGRMDFSDDSAFIQVNKNLWLYRGQL